MTQTMTRFRRGLAVGAVVLAAAGSARAAETAANRLVVIVDASGSYKARVTDAIERVTQLLDGMAEIRVKRWEKDLDRVTIVALDALPAVIWEGSAADLKAIDRVAWAQRLQARTDLSNCTDVGEAFRLAVRALDGDSGSVTKYLWIFSDLVDEPPTTSVRRCQPAKLPSAPGPDFPWAALRDVSVAAFWMPADQVLAWRRSVREAGVEGTFQLHGADSGEIAILPPERRTIAVSDEELAGLREEAVQTLGRGAKWIGWAFLAVVGGMTALVALVSVAARMRRARRRQGPSLAANAGGSGRSHIRSVGRDSHGR